MPRFSSIWDVSSETAHPRAKQLIGDSIIWDYADEDSPIGNDTGADIFAAFIRFRAIHPTDSIDPFVQSELRGHDIADADWDALDRHQLEEALAADGGYALLKRDDFIVGLAFSQLLLEGTVDSTVRDRAILALKRQSTDLVLSFRGQDGSDGRKRQLAEFRRILELI